METIFSSRYQAKSVGFITNASKTPFFHPFLANVAC